MVALKSSDIESFVARPDPARAIVLVFGPDAGLVSERVEAIIRASVDDTNDPFALVRLDGDTLASDPARLIDEATTVPLFGGRRAIRVRVGSRNIVPAIEGILTARLSDCRVVIEAGDLKRSAALRTVCERAKTAVAIPCYADAERDLGRLIDEELRAANLSIASDARAALVPLLGGDRRASRAELRKLTLYAHGRERIEIDDVMAVVADASALVLDSLVDAAFAGRLADVEKEFAKTAIAGTNPTAIVGAALRQAERLHLLRLGVDGGASASSTVEQAQPQIHFRRKPLVESALKTWTTDRLARAMTMLAEASLDARVQSALAETIAHRALMLIARGGREPRARIGRAACNAALFALSSVMAGLVPAIPLSHAPRVRQFYLYILASRPGGAIYVGVTSDLVRRVYEHRNDFVAGHTKRYHIHQLVYFEVFSSARDAIQREKNMKHWPRA